MTRNKEWIDGNERIVFKVSEYYTIYGSNSTFNTGWNDRVVFKVSKYYSISFKFYKIQTVLVSVRNTAGVWESPTCLKDRELLRRRSIRAFFELSYFVHQIPIV